MHLLIALLGSLVLSGCEAAFTKLVWSDEFNGNGLISDSEWNYETGGSGMS